MSTTAAGLMKINKVNRFGWVRSHHKPRSEAEWARVFDRHRYVLPSLQELSITLSRRGAGVAGLRRFRFDVLPAVVHHSPQLKVSVKVDEETPSLAVVSVKKADGEVVTIECQKKRDAEILELLYALDPASSRVPFVLEEDRVLEDKATKKD
jgi:hypothetical protein